MSLSSLRVWAEHVPILTHDLVPQGPVPTAYDPEGVYPYESYCETSKRGRVKIHRIVFMENTVLRVGVCPDLGGRIFSLVVKRGGVATETLHRTESVRPVRILPRHFFFGGGIEVSFPISHPPVTTVPVCYDVSVPAHADLAPPPADVYAPMGDVVALDTACLTVTAAAGDRVYVTAGERELRFGSRWAVEFSIGAGDAFLTQRAVFANDPGPGRTAHPWMSWANAGLPAAPDTEFHFPNGDVLRHDSEITGGIDWAAAGPRTQKDVHEMTGYFWKTPDANAFGAYTPSLKSGLYHVAAPDQVPGIKLWTDGDDRGWVDQYLQSGRAQVIEIQAGPLVDQSIKAELCPGDTIHYTEFWYPTDVPLDIYELHANIPRVTLRDVGEVPCFGYARADDVVVWERLLAAHAAGRVGDAPSPPGVDSNQWAPSGMATLGEALAWAADHTGSPKAKALWEFQRGTWMVARAAACGSAVTDATRAALLAAIEVLERAGDPRGLVLAARVARLGLRDIPAALRLLQQIPAGRDPAAVALHPQVVVERDLVLAAAARTASCEADTAALLDERAAGLETVAMLDDEWLVERRVDLLVAQGALDAARAIIEGTSFQRIHQRYARTALWVRIYRGLHPGSTLTHQQLRRMAPASLGEDTLAVFGAYREFEEEDEAA